MGEQAVKVRLLAYGHLRGQNARSPVQKNLVRRSQKLSFPKKIGTGDPAIRDAIKDGFVLDEDPIQ
jgi:hypothetical protein